VFMDMATVLNALTSSFHHYIIKPSPYMISRSLNMKSKHSLTFIPAVFYHLSVFISLGFFMLYPLASLAEQWTYTTRPGDNLWNISKKHLKSVNYWSRLQEYNKVDVAKQLAPGTRLRVPLEWLKVQAAPAVVVSVTGTVKYIKSGTQNSSSLTSKQTVTIGDTIISDAHSSALVQFADGSTLLLLKNSQVIFNTLSSYGSTGMVDTRLRLQQGRIETSVRPLRDPTSRYEITTPAAVAAVRGTQFRIAYQENQKSMASEVIEGAVSVAAEKVEQSVKKGFGTITEQGKPPQPPVKLLQAPDLKALPAKIRTFPYTLSWPTLEAAAKYRIQISTAQEPDAVSFEQTSETTQLTLDTFKDGQYIVRIRGIDHSGLEGFNAESALEINTHFPVATLLLPEQDFNAGEGPYLFQWTKDINVAKYQIQVSTDEHFKNVIFEQTDNTNSATLNENLAEGNYFWRVTSIDNEGHAGKPSDARKFNVSENKYEALLLLLYFIPALLL